jgi:hypothetical protein
MRLLQYIVRKPGLIYFILSLLILLPLLKPGYIFALDMTFTPDIRLPSEVTASYPLYLAMVLLDQIMPSWLVQKILLLSIFFLAGLGAHLLTKMLLDGLKAKEKSNKRIPGYLSVVPFYSGFLYMVNPFTYERLMDGQWGVLFGLALLPFFVKALLQLVFNREHQNIRKSGEVALWAVLVSVVSIHAIGYLIVISLAALGVLVWTSRKDFSAMKRPFKWLAASGVIVLAASSFWLVPALRGDSSRTQLISQFDYRHILSFRTDGRTDIGTMGNVAGLYGYWGEREDRFIVPRFVLFYWPLLALAIIYLAAYGWWRYRHLPEVNVLAIAGAIAFILSMGVLVSPFDAVNRFLYEHAPFFRGFREPQKFVAVLALAYAVLGGLGTYAQFMKDCVGKWSESSQKALLAFVLILPLMYCPIILFGGYGQLRTNEYPADWYAMNERLSREASSRVLFLPWHQYMHFGFAGRTIANPAPRFFDGKLIAGDNAEIGLIERQVFSPQSAQVERMLADAQSGKDISAQLYELQIEYVLLSKNADWQDYDYLNKQPGLQLISETDTLQLYRISHGNNVSLVHDRNY